VTDQPAVLDSVALAAEIARRIGVRAERDAPMARLTTMRVGGAADLLATAHNAFELRGLIRFAQTRGLPLLVLGRGSNLVVSDRGVRGLVVRVRGEQSRLDGDRYVAAAGVPMARAATETQKAGLSGLEFGLAIPGTVGGAIWANAGAHGSDVASVLELADDRLEAVYRSDVFAPLEIVAADLHLLAGKLIARDDELGLRVGGVFGVRVEVDDLLERRHRAPGRILIARDVGYLLEVGRADQIPRVRRVRASRVERQVAVGARNGVFEAATPIAGEGRHDQRLARPLRIGMLTVDLVEALDGVAELAGIEIGKALVVEDARRLILGEGILGALGRGAARGKQADRGGDKRQATQG